jgi:hypothetical protein
MSSDSDLDLDEEIEEAGFDSDIGDIDAKGVISEDDSSSESEKDELGEADFGDVVSQILERKLPSQPVLMGKRKVKNEVDREKFKKRKIAAKAKAKRALMNKDRIDKPQFDMQEKKLLRIATKGVVTLFNAIASRQKEERLEKRSAESYARKIAENRAAAIKSRVQSSAGFLDMLKQKASTSASESAAQAEAETESNPWGILSDNYMMGKPGGPGLKDWDKELESSAEDEEEFEREEAELESD